MTRRSTLVSGWGAVALLAATVMAAAGAPVDFSGVWKLDLAKSDFAGQAKPESKVQTVVQRDDELTLTIEEVQAGKPVKGMSRYKLDGTEVTNDVMDNRLKSMVTWDGETMVMRTRGAFGGADILLVDRWTLSEGGKILTMKRHFEGRGLVSDQTLVYARQ